MAEQRLPHLPALYTPLSKMDEQWYNRQAHYCAGFERDYYACATRVGKKLAMKELCRLEFEDLIECTSRTKQQKRYLLLQAETKRQGLSYLEKPNPDSYPIV